MLNLVHIGLRGVGKWILKLMQGFFDTDSVVVASERDDSTKKGS